MNYLDTASQSITRTIDDLRKCGSEAFASGSIDDAVRIGSWIKLLQGLVSTSHSSAPETLQGTPPISVSSVSNTNVIPSAKPAGLSRAGKREYPRFYRKQDDLVKVGWSKTDKSEYEHKAPKEAVEATAAAITLAGAAGRQFTANDLFAQAAVANLPQYQVYLAMAWLRSAGLVEQIGKQGYRCVHSDSLNSTVSQLWHELASGR